MIFTKTCVVIIEKTLLFCFYRLHGKMMAQDGNLDFYFKKGYNYGKKLD